MTRMMPYPAKAYETHEIRPNNPLRPAEQSCYLMGRLGGEPIFRPSTLRCPFCGEALNEITGVRPSRIVGRLGVRKDVSPRVMVCDIPDDQPFYGCRACYIGFSTRQARKGQA